MTNNYLGAGMGTSGLVGPLATFASMTQAGATPGLLITKIAILHFIAPAIIALFIHFLMRKTGLVKPGDMKL